jgi:hypothetical protein
VDIQNDATFGGYSIFDAPGVINNAGLFKKSGGPASPIKPCRP